LNTLLSNLITFPLQSIGRYHL